MTPRMKILLANTNDLKGGAARAASRLHLALLARGADVSYHVQSAIGRLPQTVGPTGFWNNAFAGVRSRIDALPLERYRQRADVAWSPAWLSGDLHARIRRAAPDLINLHWTTGGFVSLRDIAKLSLPTVITLHDMWPLTGGCHYSGACEGYRGRCGTCPQLGSSSEKDLSRHRWNAKRRAWARTKPTIVSPSRWLADKASASSLTGDLRIEVIPNAIDTAIYRPLPKPLARETLGLPQSAKIVLFADDSRANPRKGFQLFLDALAKLPAQNGPVHAAVFGRVAAPADFRCPIPVHWLGRFADDVSLALAYSAADVYVSCSSEEAFSLTVLEAMACGLPVVATDSGGPRDLIDEGVTGFLTRQGDADQLAAAMGRVVRDAATLGNAGREKAVAKFDSGVIAGKYLSLFQELLGRR